MKYIKYFNLMNEANEETLAIPTEKTPISGGKILFCKNKTAPLLIVYGGIPVGGRSSGDYMWDYVDKLNTKYHIFLTTFDQFIKIKIIFYILNIAFFIYKNF